MRAGMLLALPFPAVFGAFALGLPVVALLPAFVLAGTGIALAFGALALALTSREVRALRATAAAASR
jgi:Na+/H+ antiporter NhaC